MPLTNEFRVCPKCNRSKATYFVTEKDLKRKSKAWKIERCMGCGWNYDLEEVKADETSYNTQPPAGEEYNWKDDRRWGA